MMFGLMLNAAVTDDDRPPTVVCAGQYPQHLQGLAGNGKDTL